MLRNYRSLLVMACVCAAFSLRAATTPLFVDNFTVSANSTNVSSEVPGARQSGTLAPITYVETGTNANYSQVGRTSFEGQLFMAAKSDDNLVKVSPNVNFNTSPGEGGVFYIEFDVNPVLTNIPGTSTNTTQGAWFSVKFGSSAVSKTVNDADGFGILFRGEGTRAFQAFNGGTDLNPGFMNTTYTTDVTDSYHHIRIELRRQTAGANLWDGGDVEVKCFVDSDVAPIFAYIKTGGFTSNFITFTAETEGSGGDGITRHALDNIKITAAPQPSCTLSLPGGATIPPNTAFNAIATETGVTTKVEFFVDGSKVGEDTTPGNGFNFNMPGLATGTYNISARSTDAFGLTAMSAPVAILVNNRPTVSITSPLSGTVEIFGTAPVITAAANDSDGTVARVDFYRNGSKFAQDTTAGDGFTTALPTLAPGSYVLTAIAIDSAGLQSIISPPVLIIVTDPPQVTLTSPSTDLTLDEPASLTLQANAFDHDGTISRVEFLANGTKIAQTSTGTFFYNAAASGLAAGIYVITAKAFDNNGMSAESGSITVTVRSRPTFTSLPLIAPNPLLTGQTVSGTAAANGEALTWNWGDGSTSSGESVSHVFTSPGVYNVTVTATNVFGVKATSVTPVFVGQDAFGSGGDVEDGVWGILVGGDGVSVEAGAALKVSCDYRRRDRTSISAVLKNVDFPEGLTQEQLTGKLSTLQIGAGTQAIPFGFNLAANGRGKATSLKKIEVNVKKKSIAFTVTGQPGLTTLIESAGGAQNFNNADPVTLRIPATLQVGTQFFIVLTFEVEYSSKGLKGKGVLAQ